MKIGDFREIFVRACVYCCYDDDDVAVVFTGESLVKMGGGV